MRNDELVWSADYDIYGRPKNVKGERTFIPFRQVGQIEDSELEGLYYNRYRWYNSETGCYISQDPIGLAGNNPTLYGYVKNPNAWVDVFGLDCSHESGERGINKAKEDLAKAGFTDIETEVLMSVNGSDKRIRADITAKDSDGNLHVFEVKNNSGTLTPNQTEQMFFLWIMIESLILIMVEI